MALKSTFVKRRNKTKTKQKKQKKRKPRQGLLFTNEA